MVAEKEKRWLAALKEIRSSLDELGIPFFLDTGTLLGAVREKRFIPWDNDIDLGVIKGWTTGTKLDQLTEAAYRRGFDFVRGERAIYFTKAPDVQIGIMLYDWSGDSYENEFRRIIFHHGAVSRLAYFIAAAKTGAIINCNGYGFGRKIRSFLAGISKWLPIGSRAGDSWLYSAETKYLRIDRKFFEDRGQIAFYGEVFPVPASSREYLEFRYGANWETPIQDYDYFEDDNATRPGVTSENG